MADKINKEECISRVYQFLNTYNGDWKTDADRNGDGVIIKTEFSTFMKTSDFDWNGLETKKDDVITAFWKSIDTNTTGKLNNGKNISDRGALNGEELAVVGANVVATNIINKFMQNKSIPERLEASGYEIKWFNSVKAGMVNSAAEYLKKHKDEFVKLANDEEALNDKIQTLLNDELLESIYNKSAVKATADYKAYQMKDQLQADYKDLDYCVEDDKTLANIINSYIKQLKGNEDFNDVCQKVEEIIDAYRDTAVTNSKIGTITKYYDNYNQYELNPLQKAVLTAQLKQEITNAVLENDELKALYNESKDIFDLAIKNFAEGKIKTVNNFNKIKQEMDSYVEDFIKNEAESIKAQIAAAKENAELEQLRTETINYLNSVVAQNNADKTAMVKKYFGDNYVQGVNSMDKATIEANRTRLDAELATIHTVTDMSAELKTKITASGNEIMTFYVNDDGEVQFVNYNVVSGVFNDDKNGDLNTQFEKIRKDLEESYKDDLTVLGLVSEQQKKNLFNAALFAVLSDESILPSQYEMHDVGYVVEKLIEKYTKLLQKVASDRTGKTLEYISGYHRKSIMAGRTPAGTNYTKENNYRNSDVSSGMDRYYMDDTTEGGDDVIRIETVPDSITYSGVTGQIIHMNSSSSGDNKAFNDAVDLMLKDYVTQYGDVIDKSKIFALFLEAENTALSKMKAVKDCTKPAGTSVYGYGENVSGAGNDNFDTYHGNNFYNVGSILLEIMYEMEALIAKEMIG